MIKGTIAFFVFVSTLISITIFSSYSFSNGKNETCNGNVMMKDSVHGYYFEMPKEEFSKFCEKIKHVEHGDDVEIVKKLIGKPTYDQKLLDKKGNFVVRVLSYYVKIWE
jgi:hypothetical protein